MAAGSSGIFFGGLSTGIDTKALLDALMAVERRPLVLLQARKSELENERKLFQELNTKLLALRDAARAIDNRDPTLGSVASSEEFIAYQAKTSNDAVLAATASSNATAGEFRVRVERLASVGREVSVTFASSTAVVANAGETLTIQHAGPADIALTVPAAGYSLNQLRDAINADPNNGGNVRAEVLFDGTSYRLVISGTQTGQANDVGVSSTINGGAFVDGALAQTAQDAQIRYLGIAITRPGNEIADAIPGLTLRLRGTNSATDTNDATTLTVERDLPGIQAKLQALADAYNAVRDFVNAQSAYDEATKQAGPLSGNGSLRTIERIVQSSVSGLYTLAGTSLSSLSEIGLRFDQDGKLALDAAKLESALAADVSAVRTLLSGDGTDDGVATALARVLDPLTRLGDGVLAVQDQTYATTLRGFDDQIAELELRLEKREETLRRQFASLESLVGALQSQAGFLSSL